MKNNLILFLVLLCVSTFFVGCEKDDICPEATASTPLLIIRFVDSEDPDDFKTVPSLSIKSVSEAENYLTRTSTDSIAIPLKTFENFTEYEFTINDADPESEDEPTETPNSDTVNFSYATEQIYLNRACGYVVNFTLNSASVQSETPTDHWIDQIEIRQLFVENETNAHIYIYH